MARPMTKAQRIKLETIIGKLEALQHEVRDDAGTLTAAKSALLRFLRDASK